MSQNLKNKLYEFETFFIVCSVIGWIYETVLEVFIYKTGFSNRGFMHGPYCIVYGFGGVILLLFLNRLLESEKAPATKMFIAFPSIIIITTTVELIASYIMELVTGSFMWNYARFHPNFQGRIALNPSLRFGVGGMVLLFVILPIIKRMKPEHQKIVCLLIFPVMILDLILTLI